MSTSQPGPGRRRRIAGERRPRTTAPETHETAPGTAHESDPVAAGSARTAVTAAPPEQAPGVTPAPAPASAASSRLRRPRRPRRPRRRPGGLAVGLAVLLAVLVLYCGALALGWLGTDGVGDLGRADEEASAARASQASAERAAEAVLAYDFRSLEEDRDAALRFLTEEYGADYAATFDSTVTEVAQQTRARVSVEVQGSAVVDATADTAKVLLFVDQTTVSTASEQPRVALNRVEMEMVERDGTWLVDDILSF